MPISPIIQSCFPPFKDVSLFWGGTVLFFAEPKQQPQHAVLFVSLTQVVVVQEKQPFRVLPLNDISFIAVLTVDPAEKRRSIAFMSKSRNVDICVMTVGQGIDTLLKQLHLAFCTNDPTYSPPFRSIEPTKELDLHVKPRKHYQQPTVALPPTSEAYDIVIMSISRVVDVLRLCEPSSVDNATSLTEQYLGRKLNLLSMLYNIYPEYNVLQEKREITSKMTGSETKQTYRERLLLFCTKYIPDSTGIVDEVLNRYENREEELFYHLIQRYGPEPRETEAQFGNYSTNLSPKEVRERLVQFYRKYEPNKIADVDAIMSVY
ncbi:hypothetical protein LSM04_000974 [Trypanosoma melophagium]|uniref:uncharacterized protein n=1 Tax=Trypanosoma melophagium TaxID=715481 RepID=UPI00351A3EC0|nr:hypothetical protein LSM04_000974 [Trypanosoma melophagium]